MTQAFAIFTMLAILSVLIIVHECGHFSVARFFGFQTPVFGFGLPFGPSWVVGKKWGTEFRIHAFMLGGYVAIPELGDESNQDAFGPPEKPFRKFPIWQRALVAFAGVGFNILFAYLVTLVMVVSMGDPVQRVVVKKCVEANPIALNAGVKPNDEIISIDGVKLEGTADTIAAIKSHRGQTMALKILRPAQAGNALTSEDYNPRTMDAEKLAAADSKKETVELTMIPNEKGQVGMELEPKVAFFKRIDGNPLEIAVHAYNKLAGLTWSMIEALGQMVGGLVQGIMSGGKPAAGGGSAVGIGDLHGVLAVVVFGADVAQQDWTQLFLFTIMISMDLAIINLLPWPALDGGHLAFMLYEAIRGKPMEEKAQGEIVKWGFLSLIALMVVIMVNDVSALMSGKLSMKALKEKSKEAREKKEKEEKAATPAAPATPAKADESAPSTETKPAH